MIAARHDAQRTRQRRRVHRDRRVQRAGPLLRATFAGQPGHIEHRRVHHTRDRYSIDDQRDVHGELARTLDEFLGSVERIDQPIATGRRARGVRRDAILLRDDRRRGLERSESGANHRVAAQIGFGERAAVRLQRDRGWHRAVVHLENGPTRLARKRDEGDHIR